MLRDIQSEHDTRNIEINRVGVSELFYPIKVFDKAHKSQNTVAKIKLSVNLSPRFRGTHMSRFIEVLNEYRGEIAMWKVFEILEKLKTKLDSNSAEIEIEFPYFIEKTAPKTGTKSIMQYNCKFIGKLDTRRDFLLEIVVPIMTLCPCSKEISEKGAHNQRAMAQVAVRFTEFVWIEDLIQIIENCASSPVYSILKREDEKFVTEHAYEHPAFVEDVARDIAKKLDEIKEIIWYRIHVESFESIHNHNAFAHIEKWKSQK